MSDAPRILITGFEPFGGLRRNPSEAVLARLPSLLGGARVRKAVLPVDSMAAPAMLSQLLRDTQPTCALHLGVAIKRREVCLERYAVNLLDFRAPDNAGFQPRRRPVQRHAPDVLRSTFPVDAVASSLAHRSPWPVRVSDDAGEYLCNQVYFLSMLRAKSEAERDGRPLRPVLFVHLPADQGTEDDAHRLGMGDLLVSRPRPTTQVLVEVVTEILRSGLALYDTPGGA